MRRAIWVITYLVVAVASPYVLHGAAQVGQPAPALGIDLLDGKHFDLGAAKGKVVVINYWATWCPPCREEMPALDAFYREYHGQGVELLGLSMDRPRDRKKVTKVMEAFGYPAAIASQADPNGFGSPRILPMTYVIDRDGAVRAILFGTDAKPMSIQELKDAVLPLLPKS